MNRLLRHNGRFHSLNLLPGQRVYGERIVRLQGREYREWSARRSKLSAYLNRGGKHFRPEPNEDILYLGAASGTTVSHVSDLLPEGRVFAVEFSPRPFRDLLRLAAQRPNLVPLLSDAVRPDAYAPYLTRRVPLLYQDIAQRNQAQLFWENARRFLRPRGVGMLAIKARSINVARPPREIYETVRKELKSKGMEPLELLELEPFERDHAMLVVKARS